MKTDILRNWLEQGGHHPSDLHQVFSDCLRANRTQLTESFRAGTAAALLIRQRSDFIDEILALAWRQFLAEHSERLALIAVGGYGRQELHPHSDIDILVLLDDTDAAHPELNARVSGFLSFLWDIGLKLAQSVRTLEDCIEQARADQTVMTNLLECRLILGSAPLFDRLWERLAPNQLWPSPAFFEAKQAEQAARYAKYHDTAYNLEPNIKEGPGGLRDIQNIHWIIKRHYNTRSLNLVQEGWLTEAEQAELLRARDFLWEIRFALHAMTDRCEDRLLFEYQKDLARQFGVQDQNINQAVEQFMQLYYRTVMGLERLNELLMQLFQEVALGQGRDLRIEPIDEQFQAVNRYVEVRHPDVFREQPLALFQIFLLLQTRPELKGIRASTIRLIRQHLYLIDDRFRSETEACRLFMTILRQPIGVTHQLRRMNRYGVLAAYLPAFARVVGRMQYDLFHVYTVDEHTLFVVRNLRRFALEEHRPDHPLCNEVFELIDRPELLYVAALMHDIAKGSGGDHSTVGATIARDFCQRHSLSQRETGLVCWLVQNHLLMSLTAQRKDINDPEVIQSFATAVGDQSALDHLYLLTCADIRATNPSLWNSWKDALLRELYLQTRWLFRRGLAKPWQQAEKIADVKAESHALLTRLSLDDDAIDRVWAAQLTDEYFLRYHAEEAAWHTIALSAARPDELPLILLRPVSQRGSAEIFIRAQRQDFLFAHTTAVLDQLNLTVFDARIITGQDGHVLHSYHVLEQTGEPIRDPMRQVQICVRLKECLCGAVQAPLKVQRRESRQIRHFNVPTQVYFHEDPQQRHTILELIATDRPGLLSKVGRAFSLCGLRLFNARISTIGSRAEDIFYLTGQDNLPISDPAHRQALKDTIIGLVGAS